MKIGIDARMFGPKQGGLGRYVEQLILNLEKINTTDKFVIFLRQENWNDYTPQNPNFTKVLADIPWYGMREQFELPKILKRANLDLVHFPHWNVPFFYNKKFVVTIHDLILFHYPTRSASALGPFTYFIKQLGFKVILKRAVKKAEKIITVSNFSKTDIAQTLRVQENKIEVAYPAPMPEQFSTTEFNLKKYNIVRPYALYVGVAYPHKNLDFLLQAWQIFCEKTSARGGSASGGGNQPQLVLVGKRNYFYDRLLKKFEDMFALGQVIFTDFVPDQTLDSLYRSASTYVFPSLYEGFGIPPLEAMTRGVPVTASTAGSLPEILQGAALYFDPKRNDQLVEALISLFSDQKLRAELSALGKKISTKYSWLSTAKTSFEIYKNSV